MIDESRIRESDSLYEFLDTSSWNLDENDVENILFNAKRRFDYYREFHDFAKDFLAHLAETDKQLLYSAVEYLWDDPLYAWRQEKTFLGDYVAEISDEKVKDKIYKTFLDYIQKAGEVERAQDILEEVYDEIIARFDNNYWVDKLNSDEYIPDRVLKENFSKLLKGDLSKLLDAADEIAEFIQDVDNDIVGRSKTQLRLLEKLANRNKELVKRVLASENLYDWDIDKFIFNSAIELESKLDRQHNRISCAEAKEILKQEGLENDIICVEGYVGLEDMSFDHLKNIKTGEVYAESVFSDGPWFRGRTFGDKEMPRDWFLETIKRIKNEIL